MKRQAQRPRSFASPRPSCRGLRQSVSRSLRRSGYHLIAARDGKGALQQALDFKGPIQMLVANFEMPDMSGIELAQRITQERPNIYVFLVLNLDSGLLILNKGWRFLPAPFASDMLQAGIRDMLKEPHSLSNDQPGRDGSRSTPLTKREIQVIKLIAAGNSTKQTAAILGVAFKTCGGRRTPLMYKLNIHDPVALARYAIRAGLGDA